MRYALLFAASAMLLPAGGCDKLRGEAEVRPPQVPLVKRNLSPEEAQALAARLCSDPGTYERLKIAAFRQAARVRGTDSAPFERLAAFATVRMEEPLVVSGERAPRLIRCSARMSIDLPPGTAAMSGSRILTSDIAFFGQPAADGSGIVWTLNAAEPIVYPLATMRRVTGEEFLPAPVVPAVFRGPEPAPEAVPPVDNAQQTAAPAAAPPPAAPPAPPPSPPTKSEPAAPAAPSEPTRRAVPKPESKAKPEPATKVERHDPRTVERTRQRSSTTAVGSHEKRSAHMDRKQERVRKVEQPPKPTSKSKPARHPKDPERHPYVREPIAKPHPARPAPKPVTKRRRHDQPSPKPPRRDPAHRTGRDPLAPLRDRAAVRAPHRPAAARQRRRSDDPYDRPPPWYDDDGLPYRR